MVGLNDVFALPPAFFKRVKLGSGCGEPSDLCAVVVLLQPSSYSPIAVVGC